VEYFAATDQLVVVETSCRNKVSYGQVCHECGQTFLAINVDDLHLYHRNAPRPDDEHQVLSFQRICTCSASADESWYRFHIGTNKVFKQGNRDSDFESIADSDDDESPGPSSTEGVMEEAVVLTEDVGTV